MAESYGRRYAYLRAMVEDKAVSAAAVRECGTTPRRGTVVTATRWWSVLTVMVALMVGCGGNRKGDTYARGVQVQEACCEHLGGADRDACLGEVVRLDDPAAAGTATNQQTYACVVEHFVCDPTTGRETQASAQAQHDCTDDLR